MAEDKAEKLVMALHNKTLSRSPQNTVIRRIRTLLARIEDQSAPGLPKSVAPRVSPAHIVYQVEAYPFEPLKAQRTLPHLLVGRSSMVKVQ